MLLSACGLVCDDCEFFNKTCSGCHKVKGSTFWAIEMMPSRVCPLYDCSVNKKGLKDCGGCSELPCSVFLNMKDPNSTEEQHQKSIGERVARLKSNWHFACSLTDSNVFLQNSCNNFIFHIIPVLI